MYTGAVLRLMVPCALAMAVAAPAWAARLYVDAGDPSCEADLRAALDAAEPGDSIEIGKGTCELEDTLPLAAQGLTLRGRSENDVVLVASAGILVSASEVTLKKLTVRGGGILIEGEDASVDDVTVVGASGNCIETKADGTTIEDSRIEACGADCISTGSRLVFADRLTVEDTKIAACSEYGVEVVGDYATIDDSRIARTGKSCIDITGNAAGVLETDVENCSETGIRVFGESARLDRNRVRATELEGIHGQGFLGRVTNNRTRTTRGSGIFWMGQATIRRNEIDDAGSDGMVVVSLPLPRAEVFEVRRNEVEDSGAGLENDCYRISASAGLFQENEAEECPDDGFDLRLFDLDGIPLPSGGNKLSENEAEDNVANGFEVTSPGNELVENEADDNGRFDLCDPTMTVDPDDNDFETFSDAADCAD